MGTEFIKSKQQINIETRTIVTTINYDALIETFDTYEYTQTEEKITLEAEKRIAIDFSEFDNLSTATSDETTNVHYSYEYDIVRNLIYLTVTFTELEEIVSSDTLIGKAFFDENGNLDAYFDVDGELFLMSEMAELSSIQNLGWFKNIIKKVAVAVVSVVVVSTVAAVVVATAGAGMAAVVAAGAIAGAVTGGVAGALISYSEYGEVKWEWVAGGVAIGGAIGALTGWAVGSIAGAGSTTAAEATKQVLPKIGDTFGKYGTYVNNPGIKINWAKTTAHGAQRMAERGVSKSLAESIITTGKVFMQNGGEKFLYLTKSGAVVLTKAGEIVTAYTAAEFSDDLIELLKLIGVL